MIISCPKCKKKFKIDPTLIPVEGRDLQCGSCENVWFYKVENENSLPLTLNEDLLHKKNEDNLTKNEIEKITKKNENKILDISDSKKNQIKKESAGGKFFSFLIVLIISFIAFIILVDTLKAPIINVFPGIEIILFNLFETLQDIKLFIIDLS